MGILPIWSKGNYFSVCFVLCLTQRGKHQAGMCLGFCCLVALNWTTDRSRWIKSSTCWFFCWCKDNNLLAWCAMLGCCLGKFSSSLCPSASHTAVPTSAHSWVPLWSPRTSTKTEDCAGAFHRRMEHRNPDTMLGISPLKGKHTYSDGWQDKEMSEISSSVLAGFSYVFLAQSHVLERTLEVDQMARRIWNTHKADAFNSPDPRYALWADLRMILCTAVTQSKGWDSNAPAAPLFWVFSTFGLFHHHWHLV